MFFRHLRHAFRVHRRRPLTAIAVILTLALGIGACTAIFSVVDGVLLKPLRFPEPERLLRLHQTYEALRTSPNPRLQALWDRLPVSYLNAVDYRQDSRALEALGLYEEVLLTLTGSGEPRQLEAARVDAELWTTLGVEPTVGRTFDATDVEQAAKVVVLGHALWQRSFGGSADVLDRVLMLDGEPHTVVGVMPPGFEIPGDSQDGLWIPLQWTENDLSRRDNQRLRAVARLAVDVSLDEAREDLERLVAGHVEIYPDTNDGVGVRLEPLREFITGDSRSLMHLLMAAVVAVLMVACVNVAHLLLAETSFRRRELTVRLALGAGRGRLVSQLLAESLLLAVVGGALSWCLAIVGRHVLLAWIGTDLPRIDSVALDGRVLVFTAGVSILAAVVCCVLPVLSTRALSAQELGVAVRGVGRGLTSRGSRRAHSGLVVAETAITLVLTVLAVALVSGFLRLAAVEPGFRDDGVVVQEIELPGWSYPDEERRRGFSERVLERVASLPGVETAALTTKLPFAGPGLVAGFSVPGLSEAEEDWIQGQSASIKFVTPDYFQVMGMRILEGRAFTPADRDDSGRRVVVNETLATTGWVGEAATGRRLMLGFDEDSYEVIGVAANVRHDGLDVEPGALVYLPWSQRSVFAGGKLTLVAEGPASVAPALQSAIRELDAVLPLPPATTLSALLGESLAPSRARTSVMMVLAAVALVLALVGTYAVVSFTVGRQVQEIGVRMALGATGGRVRSMVMRRTLALSGLGLAIGMVGALAGSRVLSGWLFGITAIEPTALAVAAGLVMVASLLAGYLPAHRASRVDPVDALRGE